MFYAPDTALIIPRKDHAKQMSELDIHEKAKQYRKREDMAEGLPAAIALGVSALGTMTLVVIRLLS